MGTSYVSGQKVYDTFMEKLPATILLTVSSMIVTMLTAIPPWDFFLPYAIIDGQII